MWSICVQKNLLWPTNRCKSSLGYWSVRVGRNTCGLRSEPKYWTLDWVHSVRSLSEWNSVLLKPVISETAINAMTASTVTRQSLSDLLVTDLRLERHKLLFEWSLISAKERIYGLLFVLDFWYWCLCLRRITSLTLIPCSSVSSPFAIHSLTKWSAICSKLSASKSRRMHPFIKQLLSSKSECSETVETWGFDHRPPASTFSSYFNHLWVKTIGDEFQFQPLFNFCFFVHFIGQWVSESIGLWLLKSLQWFRNIRWLWHNRWLSLDRLIFESIESKFKVTYYKLNWLSLLRGCGTQSDAEPGSTYDLGNYQEIIEEMFELWILKQVCYTNDAECNSL